MENLNTALILLAVGMGTVFFILLFIIYFSNLLIRIINRYLPEDTAARSIKKINDAGAIPAKVVAAISTAVNVATKGEMKVTKIEKTKS